MNIVECSVSEFVEKAKDKKVYCYGAGKVGEFFVNLFGNEPWFERIALFVDKKECGSSKVLRCNGRIIPMQHLNDVVFDKDTVVLLTVGFRMVDEILAELSNNAGNVLNEVFVLGVLLRNNNENIESTESVKSVKRSTMQIPKIIHYCWFGDKNPPENLQNYMKSWQKYCPDYEIKKWDESNYDLEQNVYLKQMKKNKQYAHCSDFVRLDVVYNYGGIYLDCDVEIVRNVDELLYFDAFIGKNYNSEYSYPIATGSGFGAVRGHNIIKEMRDYYLQMDNSEYGRVCAFLQYQVLKKYNENCDKVNNFNIIDDSMVLFPFEYFHPYDMYGYGTISDNAFCVHHSGFSWLTTPLERPSFLTSLNKTIQNRDNL